MELHMDIYELVREAASAAKLASADEVAFCDAARQSPDMSVAIPAPYAVPVIVDPSAHFTVTD
ncbi:MAG: hypothetical protein QM610_00225 [Chitinophagaceae bacterium]